MNDVNGYDSTIKYAIMDIVGAINKIESMKQDRYLTMHPYYTYDVSSTSEKMEIVTKINSRVTSNVNGNCNDGSL